MSSNPSLSRPTITTKTEPTRRTSDEQNAVTKAYVPDDLLTEVTTPTTPSTPSTPSAKEARRLNKKTEQSKRKRNRYSFDLGNLQDGEAETLLLPVIAETASRESSRPPSRALHTTLHSMNMPSEGHERPVQGQATSSTASSDVPQLENFPGRSTSIPESPYAGVNVYHPNSLELEASISNTAMALPIDPRNLLPLSVPGTPGMSPSPSISRSASPATGFSNNASYHDSPRESVSFDRDSDQASRGKNGFGSVTATTDATGSEFETEDDEIQTGTSLSTRMPWSRTQDSRQDRPANAPVNWPWRTRRGTDDLLYDNLPSDRQNGHTRTISNEYSPLKTHGPNLSLPGRLESLTTIDSSIHSSSSYGNHIPGQSPQSTTYTQYSDYHSLPSNPNEPTSKNDQPNSAISVFSSELVKQRRGLKRVFGWIKRRVGVGASGVADLASEASQRVAGTTNATIRLPSGSLGSRRKSRKRKNAKNARHDVSWIFQILRLVPTQPSTIVS